MEIKIMGLCDSVAHVPEKPTYAIRIFSGYELQNPGTIEGLLLNPSELYKFIGIYYFDDIELQMRFKPEELLLTEDIASKILGDFRQNKDTCEVLLVHCSRGQNRAPAVAAALNDIFQIGYTRRELLEPYPCPNWYVYDTLLKVAGVK